MKILSVPNEARSCTVLIRRSLAGEEGITHQRALSEVGRQLCDRTRPYWLAVYNDIVSRFSRPRLYASRLPRAQLTLWELLHPEHIAGTDLLAGVVSLRRIDKGRWYPGQIAKNLTYLDLVRLVLEDKRLQAGQAFEAVQAAYHRFITQDQPEPRIGIGHEPAMSLAAEGFLPLAGLGFAECTGAAFYVNTASQIISVQKLVPDTCRSSADVATPELDEVPQPTR